MTSNFSTDCKIENALIHVGNLFLNELNLIQINELLNAWTKLHSISNQTIFMESCHSFKLEII